MRAYVEDLLGDPYAVRTVPFCERLAPPADDVAFPTAVEGALTLAGAGRTVRLTGRVRTSVELVCGACLRRFEQPVEVTIDEGFCRVGPADGQEHPGAQALGQEGALAPIEPDGTIDVTEVVRQELLLALPIAPRCSPDCRGLCPTCGADRNAGPCGCETEDIDPRLEALRGWATATEGPAPTGEKRRTGGRTTTKGSDRWD